jgi:hypothetical protein
MLEQLSRGTLSRKPAPDQKNRQTRFIQRFLSSTHWEQDQFPCHHYNSGM